MDVSMKKWMFRVARILFLAMIILIFHEINTIIMFGKKTFDFDRKEDSRLDMPSSTLGMSCKFANITTVLSNPILEWRDNYPSPVSNLMKLYVYETLPSELDVEKELYQRYCTDSNMNSNYKSELALLQLFRSFPGRTMNPKEADIFVVPYLHAGHCLLAPGWKLHCSHVPRYMVDGLMPHNLTYWDTNTRGRHLFFTVAGFSHTKKVLRRTALLALTSGPRIHNSPKGHIIIPQFNDHPRFQPSRIRADDDEWWTRKRNYAFVSYYGESNPNMKKLSGRKLRRWFRQDIERHVITQQNSTFGGLPFVMRHTYEGGDVVTESEVDIYDKYADSIFCPVFPGDNSWQRRFFDVILSGCLPIFLYWNTTQGTTWFVPPSMDRLSPTIEKAYPFVKGLFSGIDLAVDYDSFVIQCPGNEGDLSNFSSLRETMLRMLEQEPEEIRQRQLQMKKYALAFTFGLGNDAHRYNDVFSRIIRAIKSLI
jgi:Exostosin family